MRLAEQYMLTKKYVSYLGIPGSFSYFAAQHAFSHVSKYVGKKNFQEIFASLILNDCDNGILPLENSISGSVIRNYDLLMKYNQIHISGELYIRIHHTLAAKKNLDINSIQLIYSHPEIFKQCYDYLETIDACKTETSDSATACRLVAESKDENIAVVANNETIKYYNLTPLKRMIESGTNNYTRFITINKTLLREGNKCSIVCTVRHEPGQLAQLLQTIYHAGYNLTKIESRPMPDKPFEYLFYIDMELEKTGSFSSVLSELEKQTSSLHVLGIYQRGEWYDK